MATSSEDLAINFEFAISAESKSEYEETVKPKNHILEENHNKNNCLVSNC